MTSSEYSADVRQSLPQVAVLVLFTSDDKTVRTRIELHFLSQSVTRRTFSLSENIRLKSSVPARGRKVGHQLKAYLIISNNKCRGIQTR